MMHLSSRHILHPSSTRTIDSRHWQPYCRLGATCSPTLITQASQSQALQTELLDMGLPHTSESCSGTRDRDHHRALKPFFQLSWNNRCCSETTSEHNAGRRPKGNVCTSNMDRSGEFSYTHLTAKGFPLNAHTYKGRDAHWVWGSDEQWEGDNHCVTLLTHWQAVCPDHIFRISATDVEMLEWASHRTNSDIGLYFVHLQLLANTAIVLPELAYWNSHSASSIQAGKYWGTDTHSACHSQVQSCKGLILLTAHNKN